MEENLLQKITLLFISPSASADCRSRVFFLLLPSCSGPTACYDSHHKFSVIISAADAVGHPCCWISSACCPPSSQSFPIELLSSLLWYGVLFCSCISPCLLPWGSYQATFQYMLLKSKVSLNSSPAFFV